MSRQHGRLSGVPRFRPGHDIRLLQNGEAYFPALEAAIRRARSLVWIESYIFARDAVGRRFLDLLAETAARGVEVRVLVDGYGSSALDAAWWQPLIEAGGEARVYGPEISPWTLQRRRLRRLHRKLAMIDGQTAFISGINIQDDWDIPAQAAPRFDFSVAVEGPLVSHVRAAMEKLWLSQSWHTARPRLMLAEEEVPTQFAEKGGLRAALLLRDNFRHRRDIERAYLSAIGHARQEILIANAYFLPGRRFRRALLLAATRGVRVRLLLQGMVEYRLQHAATHALYGPLLEAGVEIHEYQPSHLHAKVAVIDSNWATIGSSNIDPFSLLLAREANIMVEDRAFASELKQHLERVLERDCELIVPSSWRGQPWHVRLRSWLAYGVVRWGLGLIGQSREW